MTDRWGRIMRTAKVTRIALTVMLVSLIPACSSSGSSASESRTGAALPPSSSTPSSTTAPTTGSTPLAVWPDPANNGPIAFGRWLDETTRAIFVINPDGTGERQLTHPDQAVIDNNPDWSPDGSKIAFERCIVRCEVWTINENGSGLKRLGPNCLEVPVPACEDRSSPAWSPDGRVLAVDRAFGPVTNDQIKHSQLALIDASTGRLIRTVDAPAPYSADVGNAGWSPDGERLVFGQHDSALGNPPGGRALFVINADGTGLRRLTAWRLNGGDHPVSSPDGMLILFRTIEPLTNSDLALPTETSLDELHGHLYTVHPDGTGLHQLTHYDSSTIVLSYSFSPNGRWITYAKSGVGGGPDIFLMRLDGTGLQPVTRTSLWDSVPDWGPAR